MGEGNPKRALILANLGTPEAPSPEKVRDYLREFLMDPYVVDIPWPMRAALVHGVILRTRPALSAEAYSKIWTERGSPLLFHLEDLVARVRGLLGNDWVVLPGMRYGIPSFASAVEAVARSGAREIVFFPLFPQYSLAATKSAVDAFQRAAVVKLGVDAARSIRVVPAFGEREEFVSACAGVARRELASFGADHVLFSFHGLPERQVRRADVSREKCCLATAACCDARIEANADCYRAQSFGTARALARALGLAPDRFSVGFQSRLGRTPWIGPHTDVLFRELAAQGVRRLAVLCPSFVADCLETLEEIGIRGREQFVAAGGTELKLIPSLNSEPAWAEAVAALARETASVEAVPVC